MTNKARTQNYEEFIKYFNSNNALNSYIKKKKELQIIKH